MGVVNISNKIIQKLIYKLKKEFYVSVKNFNSTEGNWDLGKYRVIKVYPRKYFFFKEKLCLDIFIYYLGIIPYSSIIFYLSHIYISSNNKKKQWK